MPLTPGESAAFVALTAFGQPGVVIVATLPNGAVVNEFHREYVCAPFGRSV